MGVKFVSVKLKSTFLALEIKDTSTLYWIEETREIYKGSILFGVGALATDKVAGLLSPEDKAKLNALANEGGGLSNLTAIDGTINIINTANNGKSIGVAIAPDAENALVAVDGGLFVSKVVMPEYSIEKQTSAEEGYSASYKLKRIVGDEVSYVGDTINIAKDLVLQSATLETVTEDGVPYADAKVGDPYIKMVFNNAESSDLYIPVKGLVDSYTSGDGIEIVDNKISVKISSNAHGLVAVNGALALNLATETSDGAMSAKDKVFIDSIPYTYVSRKYDISDAPIGTLIDYSDHEIRIMIPNNAEFKKQTVGAGGDVNIYYITLKTYAPNDDVVGYIERLGDQVDNEILTKFSIDKYGRKYQSTWLGVAKFNDDTGVWTYYGVNSTDNKMIGWDYRIDWYNADNIRIATDSIRINLSNEDCHDYIRPYYGPSDLTTEITELQETVSDMQGAYSWGEM